MEQLLDAGIDALIVKPMSASYPAALAALRKAHAAGVPAITLDTRMTQECHALMVGSDNTKGIALVSEHVFERLGYRGKVAFFQADVRQSIGAERNSSFHAVLAKYPDVELVYESMLNLVDLVSRRGQGAEYMREALRRTPDLDALISTTDESALGALDVISEAGLAGKILVGAFDGLPAALLAIADGRMAITVRQLPLLLAQQALDVALRALRGESVNRVTNVDVTPVTALNVTQAAIDSLQLVPGLINDLLHDQEVQRKLQENVISTQRNILETVAAVSNAASRIREPQGMVSEVLELVRRRFDLGHAEFHAAGASASGVPAPGMRSRLSVPLKVGEHDFGLLDLQSSASKAFDPEKTMMLQVIAQEVAIALDNANLLSETVRLAESERREFAAKVEAAERAEYLSDHDALTALPNRRLFSRLLSQGLTQARRYNRLLALLYLDLDRFKLINDTLGHEAGDHLLQEVAARLKTCLRESDTVARLGGDEFVVLLPEMTDQAHGAAVAKKILNSLAAPFVLSSHEFRVTVSIGISVFPQDGDSEEVLRKNADTAMYKAKTEGRNNFQFYSASLNTHSLERLAMESNLRQAIERNQFCLHYQAKRETGSGRITGVEALLRWQHPQLGMVAPMQFIPLAEETGLIIPIGKWVLRTACQQNMAWQKAGLPRLTVSINLTGRQFADDHLLQDIESTLRETGMDPGLLELEITEGVLMQAKSKPLQRLTDLKRVGIRIAIDDFGTGYCSLSTLNDFPIDTIKIDRSYIRDVVSGSTGNLTEAIIAMGRALSMTVIAQGVETQEQAEYLRAHTCDEFQGFYFDKPVAAEEFEKTFPGI